MPKKFLNGAIAALMTFLFLESAFAQQEATAPAASKPEQSIEELEQLVFQAHQDKQWVRMYSHSMKLHKRRPYVPEYMIDISIAAAALDRKSTAYHYMFMLQQQGLSYDFNRYPETELVRDTEAYEYINNLMIEAGEPSGEGSMVLEMGLAPGDLGDVAWDPSRDRFLIGTRSEGKLLAVDDDGNTNLLIKADDNNGLWSIDGLAVDPENNRLWIASTATPAYSGFEPADARRGGLFEFDLKTLERVGMYALPVDSLRHELGGIAVTNSGHVYVVDRATPIIYRKAPNGKRLEGFAGGLQLVALTDIAVTPDNSRIFIADAVRGILIIDPKARRSAMLTGPENLNQSGIYNMEFTGDSLVVTQSGISPQRIMRLALNPNGAQVDNVTPMATSLDGFDTPGVGTLRDDSIYYFANHGSQTAENLLMMATPLDAGDEVVPPDIRQFEKSLKSANEAKAQ